MKISPVQGTPTIPNNTSSGASPEKLARLKAIASGQPIEEEKEEHNEGAVAFNGNKTPSIKMQTNFTTNRDDITTPQVTETVAAEPPIDKIDANEQANGVTEATEPLSPQFAALARQRRALQVKEREIAEREKALSGPTRVELEAKLKSHALSTLQELGITYDQLTQEILAQQNGYSPEIQTLKEEIKNLKTSFDEKLTTRDQQTEQQVLNQMADNIDRLTAEGEDFELIRETKSQERVLRRIHDTWKEKGIVLDEDEACRMVEQELVNDNLKLARLKKIQGQLTPPEPVQIQPTTQGGMKTLTNKDQASPLMSRRQRAIAAMLGQKR